MNPHWNQLQERLLSHATVRAVLLLLGFFLWSFQIQFIPHLVPHPTQIPSYPQFVHLQCFMHLRRHYCQISEKYSKSMCCTGGYSNTAQGSFCCRCFYCALTYKVIAKFETFQEDLRLVKFCFTKRHTFARYIGYLANVTFNEGVRENHTGKRTSLRALNFFRQVRVEVTRKYFLLTTFSSSLLEK